MYEDKAFKEAIAQGYRDLVAFRKLFLTKDASEELPSPTFHYEWSDILLHGKDNYAVQGFRQSGKSSVVLSAFPLYCLRFPSAERNYIVIIKSNITQAEKQLRGIQTEFNENKLIGAGARPPLEASSQCFLIDCYDPVTRKYIRVRIEAYGRGSAIRGLNSREGRPKIVIIDDPQDSTDMRSNTVLDQDFEWYDSDVKYLGRTSRIFMIGNNLGKKCLIERVFDNADSFGFKTMKIPICNADYTQSAWAEAFPLDFIIKEKEDNKKTHTLHNWYRERMCEAISDEQRVFTSTMFQYYPTVARSKLAATMNTFIRFDPAVGLKERDDFSAMLVAGFNDQAHMFMLDGSYGKWTTKEKLDQLFRFVSRWQPLNVGVENSKEGKLFIERCREEMPKRNIFFKLEEVTHGGNAKEARIQMLQPRFEERTVWFPDERYDWLIELEDQLLGFSAAGSKTLHDDLIDTLAYFLQKTHKPVGLSGATAEKYRNLPRSSTTFTRCA